MMEGQETCGEVGSDASRHYAHKFTPVEAKGVFAEALVSQATTAGHNGLGVGSSAFLLHHVRESLKRKGLILGEAGDASAAVPDVRQKNNLSPIREEDAARSFKDRDAAWILARKNSRKRNKQPRSLDFSSFQVEMLSPKDIQNVLIEGECYLQL